MIPFFRKIRKNLADDNQFFKYSRYAIGEIVLVVVGILIALQINTWNEQNKLGKEENKYLRRIYNDLEKDSMYFTERILESKKEVSNYKKYVRDAYKVQNTQDEYSKLRSLQLWGSEQLKVENSTFNEMLNSGKFDLISDDSLKSMILNLYKEYEKAGNHIKEFNEFSTGILAQQAYDLKASKYSEQFHDLFDDVNMVDRSDWEYINDPTSSKFKMAEHTTLIYLSKHNLFIEYFDHLLTEVSALLDELRSRSNNHR